MCRFSGFILILCCTTLLVLQAVGLHLHANLQTVGVNLHAEHVHGVDPDGHDHSADVDVSIVELGTFWAKLAPMLLSIGLLLLVPPVLSWSRRIRIESLLTFPDKQRWRPPLRAPPFVS